MKAYGKICMCDGGSFQTGRRSCTRNDGRSYWLVRSQGKWIRYDPIFYLPQFGCSSAELEPEKKNELSHRGEGLPKCAKVLEEKLKANRRYNQTKEKGS